MKRVLMSLSLLVIACQAAFAQPGNWRENEEQRNQRMKWWTDARFGMFIHWGIYAEAARGEAVKGSEKMTNEEYRKYFDIFDPDLYNPREWAKVAKNAGMKYVVITTKHVDGFCLWDSESTDFKSTNTPYAKDLLKPFVKAFRDEGLRVGFYYNAHDWNHPEYPANRDRGSYLDYMHKQIREIMTEFGRIDVFWMDGGGTVNKNDKKGDELLELIRGLQPQIILNDRLFEPDLLFDLGWRWDYRSPEQTLPRGWITMEGKRVPWEVCHTLNGTWGYRRSVDITNKFGWKSSNQLITLLIETVSKGGNFLLNVGPTARGKFCNNTMDRLSGIGDWMEYHSRAIYGCTAAPEQFKAPENCLLTYNPETNRIYIHILKWPSRLLHLDKYFVGKVKHARFLHDASEIQWARGMGYWDWAWTGDKEAISSRSGVLETLTMQLDIAKPDVEIPVIEVILK